MLKLVTNLLVLIAYRKAHISEERALRYGERCWTSIACNLCISSVDWNVDAKNITNNEERKNTV